MREELDKSVKYITLDEITEQSLSLSVTFNDNSAITDYIMEPDLLYIEFLKPWQIIDAESFDRLTP